MTMPNPDQTVRPPKARFPLEGVLFAVGSLSVALAVLSFAFERRSHAQAALELPWCKDVAPGKKVVLKMNFNGFFIDVSKAQWQTYDRLNQSARGEFSFDLHVNGQKIDYVLDAPSRHKHYEGSVPASIQGRCDECDHNKNNNGVLLVAPQFEAWPKRNDRTRIILRLPEGNFEIELDTEE